MSDLKFLLCFSMFPEFSTLINVHYLCDGGGVITKL